LRDGAISGYTHPGQDELNGVVCEQACAFEAAGKAVCRLREGVAPKGRSEVFRPCNQDRPMTGSTSDGHIERLVKEGWLEIGLSQHDLAEVLDAVLRGPPKHDGDPTSVDADRLMEVSQALDMPIDVFRDPDPLTEQPDAAFLSADLSPSVLSLFELRLLRAFCQLQDHRTKRLLIHLAEQIVKRQIGQGGDAA
jgi:hypothetical protein